MFKYTSSVNKDKAQEIGKAKWVTRNQNTIELYIIFHAIVTLSILSISTSGVIGATGLFLTYPWVMATFLTIFKLHKRNVPLTNLWRECFTSLSLALYKHYLINKDNACTKNANHAN